MTTPEPARGLTEELARVVVTWQHPDSDKAADLAERAVVDTVAVALAASSDPTVEALFRAVGDDLQGGPSTCWVAGASGDSRTVALVNGASAHALDFDDVDDTMIGHPSAVLVPAVFATGEETDATGSQVVDAYWVGLVVCRSLAVALDIDSHYGAGWHSTGTIGAVAAAASSARLRGLSVGETRHALGIAGSLAAGSRQNFGTMTKPLHAGVAASTGVLAARLAAAGFTADQSQLESPLGYLALHDAAPGTRAVNAALVADPALNVKLHACCYYIHAAADAMLGIVSDADLSSADVSRISVTGPPGGFQALIHHRPQTGLQGKFSMEYAMAACVLDRSLGLTAFTDEAVTRPEAQRLLNAVELKTETVPPVGPPEWSWGYAVVELETTDGRALISRIDRARGHASRPLTEEDLKAKYDDCMVYGGHHPDDELFGALRGLRHLTSLRDATRRLAAGHRHEGTPA